MKEIDPKIKNKTIAIDFDGVIHRYSKGFKGQDNVYDDPTPGTLAAIKKLKSAGYRLVIVSCRPTIYINEWLKKQNMISYFDDVSNTKLPASCYIDDKAFRFEKGKQESWDKALNFIFSLHNKRYETGIICGSFDLIHPGYIRMFKEAKGICNHLIVALQDDPTIDRPDKCKPVQKFSDRKEILSSIKFIDSIAGYNTEKELSELLAKTHHDVRVLGSDYIDRKVFTGSELNKPIYYCNRDHEYSTTALKEAIHKERLNFKSKIK